MSAQSASRLLASAADLALVLDRDGVIQEVSLGESIASHRGWDELVGRRWDETVTRDSVEKTRQLVQQARSGARPKSREINQLAEGVGELPFRFGAVLLDDERVAVLGRDLRAIATLQQRMVTTQQAMDREYGRLRDGDARYRVLFHVATEGAIVADAGTFKIVEANPAAASMLERPAQQLMGETLLSLFNERTQPGVQALITVVESGGRASDVAAVLAEPSSREVTVSASLFRQGPASLVLLRLTAAVAAGDAQPKSTRTSRIMSVIEALPEGLVVIGEDLRILSANTAFCELVEQANEKQVISQPLDRWIGRQGVDLNIMVASIKEHGLVRNFSTIIRGEFGRHREGVVTGVSALDGKVPCMGFTVRAAPARLALVQDAPIPRSVEQLRELVGRLALKDIVRESADLIEKLCIEAALDVSGDNRAAAAQLLGLSRQGLYSKLRRHGLGELDEEPT